MLFGEYEVPDSSIELKYQLGYLIGLTDETADELLGQLAAKDVIEEGTMPWDKGDEPEDQEEDAE